MFAASNVSKGRPGLTVSRGCKNKHTRGYPHRNRCAAHPIPVGEGRAFPFHPSSSSVEHPAPPSMARPSFRNMQLELQVGRLRFPPFKPCTRFPVVKHLNSGPAIWLVPWGKQTTCGLCAWGHQRDALAKGCVRIISHRSNTTPVNSGPAFWFRGRGQMWPLNLARGLGSLSSAAG